MRNKEIDYDAPAIEVINVYVEEGYNGSGSDDGGISAPGWGII